MGSVLRLLVPLLAVLLFQTIGSFAEGGKLRVLALHGYNGNGASLCQAFSTWDPAVLKLVEFNCLNGPFQDKYSKNSYTWFNLDSSRSGSKINEGVAYVLDYMRKTGPYDGILGFSMGGVMAGVVTGVQDKKKVILGRKSGDLPPLRFSIIDQGGYVPGLLDVFDPPLSTRSFHIIGNYDGNKQAGESFLQKWKNPTVARVNMPHAYLTGQYMSKVSSLYPGCSDHLIWRVMDGASKPTFTEIAADLIKRRNYSWSSSSS